LPPTTSQWHNFFFMPGCAQSLQFSAATSGSGNNSDALEAWLY
jgi:hypothetical protein